MGLVNKPVTEREKQQVERQKRAEETARLMRQYDRGTLYDHGLTKSLYFFAPDGNRLEIFSQEMTPAGGKQYLPAARTGLKKSKRSVEPSWGAKSRRSRLPP